MFATSNAFVRTPDMSTLHVAIYAVFQEKFNKVMLQCEITIY